MSKRQSEVAMTDLYHQITIEAPAEHVFAALTTQEGLRAWWTEDSVAEARPGGMAEFGFMERSVVFRMRIDELDPPHRIAWSCVGGPPDWVGTTISFELAALDARKTKVSFVHADAHSEAKAIAERNTTWGCLMRQLKHHLEGTPFNPVFKVSAQ
jgi:uncharacterized protein YndB with AHSA1/START domain